MTYTLDVKSLTSSTLHGKRLLEYSLTEPEKKYAQDAFIEFSKETYPIKHSDSTKSFSIIKHISVPRTINLLDMDIIEYIVILIYSDLQNHFNNNDLPVKLRVQYNNTVRNEESLLNSDSYSISLKVA